jgi:tetratricopeptide (TPR) repeat protein
MKIVFYLLLILASSISYAQTITPDQRKKADEYFQSKNWKQVIESYSAIAKEEPQNWNAKMRWAVALTHSGKAKEAIPLLEEAATTGKNGPSIFYLASAYAKEGNKEKAFEWLNKSITSGLLFLNLFEEDEGFLSFKNDPLYASTYERLKQNTYPCLYSKEARQFDFWVGEWDVKSTTGQNAGKSKIEKMLGECVIFENWTSALPNIYAGKSINLYNSATKKWMQTWVDDKGGLLEFINGEYKDNQMVFVTLPDPQKQITRLTFFNLNPNLVRQVFEVTTDDGATWKTTTDLFYNRVVNSPKN